MPTIQDLVIIFGAIPLVIMTVAYFLAPQRVIPEKNEYIKFALVFLSFYAALFSLVYLMFGAAKSDFASNVIMIQFALWFFPVLFISYALYRFKTVAKNRHVGFFLFWAALVSLPLAVISLISIIGQTL